MSRRLLAAVIAVAVATVVVPVAVLAATAPEVTVALTPASPNGTNGWYTTDVQVDWTVTGDPEPATTDCADFDVTEDGAFTYGCLASNPEGTATKTVTFKRDATKPTISAAANTNPNGAEWYNTDVVVSFTCVDPESNGVASGLPADPCPDETVTSEGARVHPSTTVTDNAGNVSEVASLTLKIDKTQPVVSAVISPPPSSEGWTNSDTTVDFSCADSLSLVDPAKNTIAGVGPITDEGSTEVSSTGSCTDYAGNVSDQKTVVIKIDKTPPTVNCTAPAIGTYSSNVSVPCVAQDNLGGSGLADAADVSFSLAVSGPGTDLFTESHEVCDNAGNCVTKGPFGPYTIDGTGPEVTLTVIDGTEGDNGWYTSDVTVHAEGLDEVLPVNCGPDQTQSSDTNGRTFTATCTNGAGIEGTGSLTVKLDKTPPTLSPATSVNPVVEDADVEALPNASDATSGIASASCEDLDTSSAGDFEVECMATDNAGNTAMATLGYTVIAQETGEGGILFGNTPPSNGGFGTFAFGGGTFAQLLDSSGCPSSTAVFFYNKPDGTFAVWVPGTSVSAVNSEIISLFSSTIPHETIFTARCV